MFWKSKIDNAINLLREYKFSHNCTVLEEVGKKIICLIPLTSSNGPQHALTMAVSADPQLKGHTKGEKFLPDLPITQGTES